jgi:uncharacterized protein YkwD
MMVSKVMLCAAALVLAVAQATQGQETQSQPAQTIEQKTSEAQETSTNDTASTEGAEQQMSQSLEDANATQSPTAAKPTEKEPAEKEVDGVKLQAIEANIVSYTNQERARYGLEPLVVDKELMETAREHAAWMTQTQNMVHTSRPVAENIAMGQPHSSDVVQAWMNSSGHRANILNPGHRRIGVAAFRAVTGTIFWCQQFLQ